MDRFSHYKILCLVGFLHCGYMSMLAQEYYNSAEFKIFHLEKKALDFKNSESVLAFLDHWSSKTQKADDSVAMAYVWMTGAQYCQRIDKLQEAVDYGRSAAKIISTHSLSDEFLFNKMYHAIANGVIGNFESAIEIALESIDEFNIQDPYENRANFYVLADAYLSMHNYEKMDEYLQKWYSLVKEKNLRMDLGFALYSIHEHYDIAQMFEKASFFENEFYQFYAKTGENISNVPEHAFITISGDSAEEKIEKLLKYLPYHVENNRGPLISKTNRHLGRLYLEIGKPAKALDHFQEAILRPSGISYEMQLYSIRGLSEAYSLTGQPEQALANINLFITLQDSFKNEQVLVQANELEAKYENEKKELQLEIKETQIQAKNGWLLFSAIAGLVVLTLAGFIFFLYRKLRSSNVTISTALREKETLLQEIHHRVKNNLQVISSLLSLQSKYVKDETAISALNEGQNRVESMALIHQNLYREDNITGVNMKNYIPLLADNIFNSYNIQGDQIKIEYEIDEVTLDVATVIPIGLVLNELISNALKYAFSEKEKGELKVSFLERQNTLLLKVADNGVGLGDKEVLPGFGTKLIKSFTRKLEGELNIYSENGTTVEILIKNYQRAS